MPAHGRRVYSPLDACLLQRLGGRSVRGLRTPAVGGPAAGDQLRRRSAPHRRLPEHRGHLHRPRGAVPGPRGTVPADSGTVPIAGGSAEGGAVSRHHRVPGTNTSWRTSQDCRRANQDGRDSKVSEHAKSKGWVWAIAHDTQDYIGITVVLSAEGWCVRIISLGTQGDLCQLVFMNVIYDAPCFQRVVLSCGQLRSNSFGPGSGHSTGGFPVRQFRLRSGKRVTDRIH